MSKTASIVVYTVIFVLALLLCVLACLPDGLQVGDGYWIYHSPINYIQGDNMFADVQQTAYKVKLDEDADINQVAATIRSRLADMYGYWFCDVQTDSEENQIVVNVPVTANENNTSATSILSSVTQTGKVEILTSSTYSADDVILTSEHIKSMSTRRYSSASASYYIINVTLTDEGSKIASSELTSSSSSWSAYMAIDGTVSYGIAYSGNILQVYTSSESVCTALKGLIKSGTLKATLTEIPVDLNAETNIVSHSLRLIYGICLAVIILGSWIFYVVRYGKVALSAILSQLIAIVIFIIFAGMVYFNLLNIASAIGILAGYALMSYFSCTVMEKIKLYGADKTFASARHRAFKEDIKWNCIIHAIVLVVGIILWLIPTGVTAPLGNALVYSAVLSFGVTMGLNRLFSALLAPIC